MEAGVKNCESLDAGLQFVRVEHRGMDSVFGPVFTLEGQWNRGRKKRSLHCLSPD